MAVKRALALCFFLACGPSPPTAVRPPTPPAPRPVIPEEGPDDWRKAHELIDMHEHIDPSPEHLARAVKIMDAVGIGVAVNLSGGTVTHEPNMPSDFERAKRASDTLFPGRFLLYMNLDYRDWNEPDFSERAATNDRNFSHMTPIQGDWTISGIGLPREALAKIYFQNAKRLLARSLRH